MLKSDAQYLKLKYVYGMMFLLKKPHWNMTYSVFGIWMDSIKMVTE